jgi:ABC-2 type transport system permease protein
MTALHLYARLAVASLRGQMQYRASFFMSAFGHFVTTGIEFIGILVLFDRFRMLKDWQLAEVALFYGIINISFALAEGIARGFDHFPPMVRRGDFDRVLVRPRSTGLQVAGSDVQLMRIGRLLQGLAVLTWASLTLGVVWTPWHVLLIAFAVVGGACLFSGLFVIQATISFWTTEALETMNTVTYGGVETAQFPLSIYKPGFRSFFTYVVPLATVSYFPALRVLGRVDTAVGSSPWFQAVSPAIGILFLLVTLLFWEFGVRHYRSTGN